MFGMKFDFSDGSRRTVREMSSQKATSETMDFLEIIIIDRHPTYR